MRTVISFHNFHWYFCAWLIAFTLCVLLIWIMRESFGRGYEAFIPLVPLAVAVSLCPLTAAVLVPRFLPAYREYERLSWLYFTIPVIAYTLIMLKDMIAARWQRLLFIAAAVFVLFIFSQPDNRAYFKKAENPYKISQEAVELCDMIRGDYGGSAEQKPAGVRHPAVYMQVESKFYKRDDMDAEGRIFFGIRSYASDIYIHTVIVRPFKYNREDFIPAGRVPDYCDYYIGPKIKPLGRWMDKMNYEKVGESEHFELYRNTGRN